MIKNEKTTLENDSKFNIIYNVNHSFYKYYRGNKKLIIFVSNQSILF